jgi:hypothetical protein
MKLLNELLGYKQFETKWLADILIDLIKEKKIKVDRGSFAFVVIPESKNYVFKVWTVDEGFDGFLKYIKANQDDKHLPKLIGSTRKIKTFYQKTKRDPEFVNVQRVEKLYKLDDKQIFFVAGVLNAIRYGRHKQLDAAIAAVLKEYNEIDSSEKHTELTEQQIGFVESYFKLKNFLRSQDIPEMVALGQSPLLDDVRGKNVMQRKDGTIVITDAFYTEVNSLRGTAASLLNGLERFMG